MISKKRAFVYIVFLAAASAVVWQYTQVPLPEEPDTSALHRGLPSDPESVDPHKARSTLGHAGRVRRGAWKDEHRTSK